MMASANEEDVPKTRSQNTVYLVGSMMMNEIYGSKLPCNTDALARFFYIHKKLGHTVRDSSSRVIDEVLSFWTKSRLPVRQRQHCISKLEAMFLEWKTIQKHQSRRT